ncbi:scavenger receptor class B member 1 [Polistes fuscatus]|uniref:scavenger receptor class B member 1 n=1 Tax=Polistes fuscatus TaxID=30207 RepID=UPI001CAA0F65|nr:scavenger receptor class B member 1 [Polistes fuscatus]XP_043498615.1 scavenger receptor class B member 1 [Polistes fuscatus]XP_043498616.1 scavenger receptor class B member 1 [Polistes fuscatus]
MRVNRGICAKLQGGFLRRWWAAVALGVLLVIIAAILAGIFPKLIEVIVNKQIALKDGGRTFGWWKAPPVTPLLHIYIYNVTNADEFLNNGDKPILNELGPYVYKQRWEKADITFNGNDTISYKIRKTYVFTPELSVGSDDDLVVVPNVPMLSATSQSKYAARFLRLAMASIMDILKIKPFVEVSVEQLLWGYEDPLLKLAKDVVPKEPKFPFDQFGLLYGKNGTQPDWYTVFSGDGDVTKYGLIEKWEGKKFLGHWTSPSCDSIMGSDGSIFPPRITKDTVLKIFDKDLCRALPLVFQKEVMTTGEIPGYRFTPPTNVFASPDKVHSQQCFCPAGPPCAPEGTFNVSACQFDSPVLLSFPHFYMADPALREAVIGVSPPVQEKHELFVDVQPMMGTALRARARIQINLAVSQVRDIKQVASFPDIIFPIMWFEDVIDELPPEMRSLLKMAVDLPPIVRAALSGGLAVLGVIILIGALCCLARAAKRQEKLHLSNPLPANASNNTKSGQLNPAFQNSK